MESSSTKLYRSRKERGVCPVCGGYRDDKSKSLCSGCLKYRRAIYKTHTEKQTREEKWKRNLQKARTQGERNKRLREQGLCVRCQAPAPDHWECDACREKRRKWNAEHGYA